jgi:hypothetical protein
MPALIEILQVRNLTMGMDLYSSHSGQRAEVVEHGEKKIVFEAKGTARIGQVLSIHAQLSGLSKNGLDKFEASGKIVALDHAAGKTRFTMALDLFDKDKWEKFRDLADKDQSRCDRIFKAIRGEDE